MQHKRVRSIVLYLLRTYLYAKGPWNLAADDDRDYSYHWVIFKDVDGDGLDDVLAARCYVLN